LNVLIILQVVVLYVVTGSFGSKTLFGSDAIVVIEGALSIYALGPFRQAPEAVWW